jgi:radial spoke head protein 9
MKAMPAIGLTELDRLSYVINAIENQCQIVPCGSYKKNTLGEVLPNDAFAGLATAQLTDLNQFMHLRPVEQEDKREQALREEDIFIADFLDNSALDQPHSSWSIHKDPINPTVVTIRSRLWPGFFAYHRGNTGMFGGVYMGDGVKNIDLPFML